GGFWLHQSHVGQRRDERQLAERHRQLAAAADKVSVGPRDAVARVNGLCTVPDEGAPTSQGAIRTGKMPVTRYFSSFRRMFLNSTHIGFPAWSWRARMPSVRASWGSLSVKSRMSRLFM